ncbi:MAG: hypothetical protein RB292_03680 [Patescibacteria group bacterium]|jgi:hypothetical protein|nr:hypothetical protein [Patescibacteria group bacterium]
MEEDKFSKKISSKPQNIWIAVSAFLAVALVAVLIFSYSGGFKANSGMVEVSQDEIGSYLVDFINKIYGPQIGNVSLQQVAAEHGLYKITIGVTVEGQPPQQEVYVTRDGKLFIPQAIDIDEINSEYEQYLQQQNQVNVVPTDIQGEVAPAQ